MTVFVDSGLFYALQREPAGRYEPAKAALERILDGSYGMPVTSDYVVDETVTLVRSHSGQYEEAREVVRRILGRGNYPDVFDLRYVSPERFRTALDVFERYRDHSLSFTDATTVAMVQEDALDYVLAFDDDFDGIVDRLDPETL